MRFLSLILILVPATVSACEGDCIVGITNAWISNYTVPVQTVVYSIAEQIRDLIPSHPTIDTTLTYLAPIRNAYEQNAYQNMENGIFPGYFHGKCLDEHGIQPPGCPDPDCPVVCGTPGSLVHFFPKLRYIAFNQTFHLLEALSSPGSKTYTEVEQLVVDASKRPPAPDERRRRGFSRVFSRDVADAINVMRSTNQRGGAISSLGSHSGSAGSGSGSGSIRAGPSALFSALSGASGSRTSATSPKVIVPLLRKREQDVKDGLRSIVDQQRVLLAQACGGGMENSNGLPHCSWEDAMKKYILSFP